MCDEGVGTGSLWTLKCKTQLGHLSPTAQELIDSMRRILKMYLQHIHSTCDMPGVPTIFKQFFNTVPNLGGIFYYCQLSDGETETQT